MSHCCPSDPSSPPPLPSSVSCSKENVGERGTALCEKPRLLRFHAVQVAEALGVILGCGAAGVSPWSSFCQPLHSAPTRTKRKGSSPLILHSFPTSTPSTKWNGVRRALQRERLICILAPCLVRGEDAQLVCRSPRDILPIELGVCKSAVPPGYLCCRAALLGIPPPPPHLRQWEPRREDTRLFLPAAISAPAQARAASW